MSYYVGYFVGILISAGILIFIGIRRIYSNIRVENIWRQRVEDLKKNREAFYTELEKIQFVTDVDFSYSNYYRTSEPVENMAFKADLEKRLLAIGSFDDGGCSKIFDFSEIVSFSIIDGERNTTLEGYSIGGATGGVQGVIGATSTTTYQETEVGNIKLKIEVNDVCNPIYIFVINKFYIDVTSERYSKLVDTIEKIKAFLRRIIEENKN